MNEFDMGCTCYMNIDICFIRIHIMSVCMFYVITIIILLFSSLRYDISMHESVNRDTVQ